MHSPTDHHPPRQPSPPPETGSPKLRNPRRTSPALDDVASMGSGGDIAAPTPVIRDAGSAGRARRGGPRLGSGGARRQRSAGSGCSSEILSPPNPGRLRPGRKPEPLTGADWVPACSDTSEAESWEAKLRSEVCGEEESGWQELLQAEEAWMKQHERIVQHIAANDKQPERQQSHRAMSKRFTNTGRLLGTGAYARVYEGYDEDTGKFVAIKEIYFEGDPEALDSKIQRIALEVRVMKQLTHDHIVRYVGAEREGNVLRIYTEYVSGGSIQQLLQDRGGRGFAERTVRLYTRQILLGLAFLHSRGVAHRDIKGGNVLLEKTTGCVKLSDFNSSKELESMAHGAATLVGTPCFMAPEIVRGEPYGMPADIWSLGCTVIEMLSGEPPWMRELQASPEKKSPLAALFLVAQQDALPALPEGISPQCESFLLEETLRRDPGKRSNAVQLLTSPFVDTGRSYASETGPPPSARSAQSVRSSGHESPFSSPALAAALPSVPMHSTIDSGVDGGHARGRSGSLLRHEPKDAGILPLCRLSNSTPPGSRGSNRQGSPSSGLSRPGSGEAQPRPGSGGFVAEMQSLRGDQTTIQLLEDARFKNAKKVVSEHGTGRPAVEAFTGTPTSASSPGSALSPQQVAELQRRGLGRFGYQANSLCGDSGSPLQLESMQ